jgi:uncharacterized membrane protein YeaQ/YmgE (transglycosylase-associated protein family)
MEDELGRTEYPMEVRLVEHRKSRELSPTALGESAMLRLVCLILVGLVVAWLAGKILKGRNFGIRDLMICAVVAILGEILYRVLGLLVGGFGILMLATVWTTVLLFLLQKVKA